MENKKNKENYTEFHKRAIDLLVQKFVRDYDSVNDHSIEIESMFEDWAKNHIRETEFRDQVWRGIMAELVRRVS